VSFGEITHYVLLQSNITEKKRWEKRLEDELEENRILLKEVHHRVKNNLTIVSSLLNMQANQNAGPEEMAEMLTSSQNRIFTMALVHEKLYNSDSFRSIDIASYMQSIISELTSIYAAEKTIDVVLEVEEAEFDLNRAIPCGLILNELLTNTFKHAFSDRNQGRVRISYSHHPHEGERFVVEDDGRGLPEEFDPQSSDSLGIQLVSSLACQLGGTVAYSGTRGTRVELLLPCDMQEITERREPNSR
jgi:two-component sensor histidine kinase